MSATAAADRVRDAWEGYRIACSEVEVGDYPETEAIAWELLQHELREIATESDAATPG